MGRTKWLSITLVVIVAVAAAAYLLRPPPLRRVAYLGMDSQMQATRIAAFRDEMAKRGYVEGRNLAIEYRWAEGRFDRLPELAQELVALRPEVIITAAPPPVRALQNATSTVPVVMTVHDPVGLGFVATLARPGGNVTGIAFQDSELSTKRLDLFRRIVPGLARVAIVWNEPGGGTRTLEEVQRAATALNIETRAFEIRTPADIAPAIADAKAWGAQGVMQLAAPFLTLHRRALLEALAANRMPASCELRLYVDEGCLMTYSADLDKEFRGMAAMAARILEGAKPADIAIEQPREFDFVVNMKTANALGLAISPLVLIEMTDRVK